MKHDSITIYTAANQPVRMSDLWRDQSALLFFLRNPGCAICRQQLFGLKQRAGEFAARGIALAAVTQANPTVMASLETHYQLPFPMYSDQRGAAYRALGFYETTPDKFETPEVERHAAQAAMNGFELGDAMGVSPTQLGGLAIFAARAEQARFIHVADPIYYYPPWDMVLELVRQAEMVAGGR